MRILLIFLCLSSVALAQTDAVAKSEVRTFIVYGSNTCHYCLQTKAYLQEKAISFIYYDIDENETKLQEMLSKMSKAGLSPSNVQLPVIDKAGEIFMNDKEFTIFLKYLILNSKL
ncbi:glutaredoxin family protein [Patiriisocius marinus]|uniref:glutaredoxin family protein n=1 Tax=Patiriisocius marinus TaxID=1397112 RepID=UPI002330E406|nr:glutaredoxin family protein [Patiriisocius marinus]